MKKKIIYLFIAGILAMGILTSCGDEVKDAVVPETKDYDEGAHLKDDAADLVQQENEKMNEADELLDDIDKLDEKK